MSAISTADSLKMIRETMCLAEHALHESARAGSSRPSQGDFDRIRRILEDIDRQRPLGSNGKHGNLHTPTCGCES